MLVLVILALIWAAVLVPPYLQNRRESRPGDSIATYELWLESADSRMVGELAVELRVSIAEP